MTMLPLVSSRITRWPPGKTMTLRANRIDFLQATSPEDPPVPVHEGVA
jgi:hypothetical protein